MADLETIPAMIEEIDDDTALEIAIIENLQREDLSPLDEAIMYDRMTSEHGYCVRKLAQKLGKDKGYIENRLRLADAPPEIKRARVFAQRHASRTPTSCSRSRIHGSAAGWPSRSRRGELSLVRLREKIEGRRSRGPADVTEAPVDDKPTRGRRAAETDAVEATAAWTGVRPTEISEDSLISAKGHLAEALDELVMVLRSPEALDAFGDVDRGNLAKYLTISKLKLENAIALVRSGTADREG